MNRLYRLLAMGGLLATSVLSSLTACAEAVPPKGASAPTTSQATTQDATANDATATPPPLPSAADAPANASAEPPNPSEYDVAADTDPAALTDFRGTLEPYGTWEDDATYGNVWVPASTVVGVDFTPYVTHGHWSLTASNSWLWVSDFSWGWAPFHYGRWVWIGGRGWAWIPGRVYSPAWVVWRTGYYDDWYVGWAPMPPVWYWRSGFAVSLWYVPPAPYVFCSSRYVFSPRVRGYILPPERVGTVAPRTQPYVGATAGVRGGGSTYRMASASRGPTMSDAHVPTEAVPSTRASHDPRAMSFAQSTARPVQSRTFGGTQPGTPPSFSRPSPASAPNTFSRPLLPPTTPAPAAEVPRPMSPSTLPGQPRTFSDSPAVLPPTTPHTFSPPPAPVAPRSFSPSPSPAMPPSFSPSPSPAPIAPRSFSPPPVAPRSFSPPPVAPRSFSPAPVAPRSFSPAPVAPRSFSPPSVAPRSFSPAPAAGRSFGGRR